MIKQRQATLYRLFCDNCGRQFEWNDYDEFFDEFFDADDMLDEAADDAGWVGLYDGKKEPEEDKDHLSYAEQHFCCEECRDEYLAKLFKKGGGGMMRLYLFLRRERMSFALLVVLEFIYRHPGCLIEEIARAMRSTRTPVWNKVHFLRQGGLVESRRYLYGNDCRRRGLHETEKGRKLILRYFGIYGC